MEPPQCVAMKSTKVSDTKSINGLYGGDGAGISVTIVVNCRPLNSR